MKAALEEAEITPDKLTTLMHTQLPPMGDVSEIKAITAVFKES
jgi:3-oxoacyl-(acyl-carrier-protein) synthase